MDDQPEEMPTPSLTKISPRLSAKEDQGTEIRNAGSQEGRNRFDRRQTDSCFPSFLPSS
jgi:hypothetical protein